jgi:putative hydrolase of HD superfamily
MPDDPAASRMLDFLLYIGKLKTLKRTGWIRSGVNFPESDSDHMHRAAICAMLIPSDGSVDRDRCIKMALTHDVCECIAGDFTPHCPITKQEKHRLEREALVSLKGVLGENISLGYELLSLFDEYEKGETPEAILVKDIDKFELILQAHEYEEAQNLNLEQFFASTRACFKTDLFRSLDAELIRRRGKPS